MASFKASSGTFVSVSVVFMILLAVIINIYSAAATATASLEAVEEVAKDQGTTEVARVHDLEIRGRVLMGSIPNFPFRPKFKFPKGKIPRIPKFRSPPPPRMRSSFTP